MDNDALSSNPLMVQASAPKKKVRKRKKKGFAKGFFGIISLLKDQY